MPNPPKPRPSEESRDEYVSRCMSAQEGNDSPRKQNLAACFSAWRRAAKSEKVKSKREGS